MHGSDGKDFKITRGTLVFQPKEQRKDISLQIQNDDVPEVSESFTVTLIAANGGGDIDFRARNATVTIRYFTFLSSFVDVDLVQRPYIHLMFIHHYQPRHTLS